MHCTKSSITESASFASLSFRRTCIPRDSSSPGCHSPLYAMTRSVVSRLATLSCSALISLYVKAPTSMLSLSLDFAWSAWSNTLSDMSNSFSRACRALPVGFFFATDSVSGAVALLLLGRFARAFFSLCCSSVCNGNGPQEDELACGGIVSMALLSSSSLLVRFTDFKMGTPPP